MLRKTIIVALVAGALALPAHAQKIVSQQLLMPGVTYQRQVQFTSRGPVVLDVVTAPKPDGSLYTLGPALAHGALLGTEPLTAIEKDASGAATVVGVNGDFFATNGPPTGIVMRASALDAPVLIGRGIRDEIYTDEKLKKDLKFLTSAEVCVFEGGHEWSDEFRAVAARFLERVR